ncbi:hypothetical protein ACFQ0G_38210 [Streptomyces chiangmaiensis]
MWRAGRAENTDRDRERLLNAAWGQLTGAVGAQRARWLVRLLTPESDTRPPTPVPDPHDPVPEPTLPAVTARGGGWTRAATASTLPDMFVVRAYQGDRLVGEQPGLAVPDVVQVGPDLDAVPTPGEPHLDPELLWLTKYEEAERKGLAVTVELGNGYDPHREPLLTRVVAFGVSGSLDPDASATRLTTLLSGREGHGEAAFVLQGTPTNNLPDARTPAATPPDVDRLLATTPATPADPWANGTRTAAALGLPAGTLDALPGADEPEQADARNLQLALWSATGDFYLDELLAKDKGGDELDVDRRWLRSHHFGHVRARGPLPVLRVGRQPYGLLPVTATGHWGPTPTSRRAWPDSTASSACCARSGRWASTPCPGSAAANSPGKHSTCPNPNGTYCAPWEWHRSPGPWTSGPSRAECWPASRTSAWASPGSASAGAAANNAWVTHPRTDSPGPSTKRSASATGHASATTSTAGPPGSGCPTPAPTCGKAKATRSPN